MRKTITDTDLNHLFLVFAGIFILLFLVFSSFQTVTTIFGNQLSEDVFVYKWHTDATPAALFTEDADEEDVFKGQFDCQNGNVFRDFFYGCDYNFLNRKPKGTNTIDNYFQNDLSPPLFMKG